MGANDSTGFVEQPIQVMVCHGDGSDKHKRWVWVDKEQSTISWAKQPSWDPVLIGLCGYGVQMIGKAASQGARATYRHLRLGRTCDEL